MRFIILHSFFFLQRFIYTADNITVKNMMKKKSSILAMLYSAKKHASAVAAVATVAVFSLVLLPSLAFSAGNIFFGGVKPLYNLRISRTFYLVATHPLVSNLPPRYAHHQLSRTYFIEGDLNRALDEARKELAIYPDNTSTYYVLGLTYGYLGRRHEGIEAFSRYIDSHPDTWAARNDKAWLQFRIGDIDGAIATIEPIVKQFPYTPWVQNTYCSLLVTTKNYREAKGVCEHARDIIARMTVDDWGRAYPGNDPRIYDEGLEGMRESIEHNIELLEEGLGK
jgi:tetratricopeptide (TPR) repeat protein